MVSDPSFARPCARHALVERWTLERGRNTAHTTKNKKWGGNELFTPPTAVFTDAPRSSSTTPGAARARAHTTRRAVPRIRFAMERTVTTYEEYEQGKREFRTLYKRYQQLDVALAQNTADFDRLESECKRAQQSNNSEEAKELSERIVALWKTRQKSVESKCVEQRRLHIQLSNLKKAVNHFVREQRNS